MSELTSKTLQIVNERISLLGDSLDALSDAALKRRDVPRQTARAIERKLYKASGLMLEVSVLTINAAEIFRKAEKQRRR